MARMKLTSKGFHPKLMVQHPDKQQGCDLTALRLTITTPHHRHAEQLLSTVTTRSDTFIHPKGTVKKSYKRYKRGELLS